MALCRNCGEDNPARAKFCLQCGAPLEGAAPSLQVDERKIVSVLFCDLVGFTARSEAADPEDVRALIRPYHACLRAEIERFGGTVEKFIGDAVMAVFGAPLTHEDDAERAVRAALRILEALQELNAAERGRELAVRIGINTGEVVVARGARPELGEGSVTGDVVNTAARLQTAAPVGGIAVGVATYRTTKSLVSYEELSPVQAKGKAAPVAAWRPLVARARFGTDVTRSSATPLVGRELGEGAHRRRPTRWHPRPRARARARRGRAALRGARHARAPRLPPGAQGREAPRARRPTRQGRSPATRIAQRHEWLDDRPGDT